MWSIVHIFFIWFVYFQTCHGRPSDSEETGDNREGLRLDALPLPELVKAEKEGMNRFHHKVWQEPLFLPFDLSHFNYSTDEWKILKPPARLRHSPEDDFILVAQPSDPSKQLKMSLETPDYSLVRLSYRVFLKTYEATTPPELKVLLVSKDGSEKLLKSEDTRGQWANSSVEFTTEKDNKIFFAVTTNYYNSEVGISNVTLEKVSALMPERYARGESGILLNKGNQPLSGTRSKAAKITYYNEVNSTSTVDSISINSNTSDADHNASAEMDTRSFPDEQKGSITSSLLTSPSFILHNGTIFEANATTSLVPEDDLELKNGNMFNLSDDGNSSENTTHTFTTSNSSSDVNTSFSASSSSFDAYHNITSSLFDTSDGAIFNGSESTVTPVAKSNVTITTVETYSASPSGSFLPNYEDSLNITLNATNVISYDEPPSAKGVFNFFIVIIACSVGIMVFLYWRRVRRKREDEIPVFSRAATEHGNPAFLDDDAELDITEASNYRSFR